MTTKSLTHTPGPWKYDGEFVSARVQPSNEHYPGDTVPATICELSPFPEWEANARLIAAAPDLLRHAAIAAEILRGLTMDAADREVLANLDAAIAKAGGR